MLVLLLVLVLPLLLGTSKIIHFLLVVMEKMTIHQSAFVGCPWPFPGANRKAIF